jgi:hypothetical protein
MGMSIVDAMTIALLAFLVGRSYLMIIRLSRDTLPKKAELNRSAF